MGIDLVINPENATAVEISRLLALPLRRQYRDLLPGPGGADGLPRCGRRTFWWGSPAPALSSQVKSLPILFCAADRRWRGHHPRRLLCAPGGRPALPHRPPTGLDRVLPACWAGTPPRCRNVFRGGRRHASLLSGRPFWRG
ncbi:MAG: hypothetical protein ACLRWQ_06965 [Flavonifractor plautii]